VAHEKVAPVAQQVAGEVKENLREPAQQAVESVKSTAQDPGQTVAEEGLLRPPRTTRACPGRRRPKQH
jgi:hypothetical protein